MSRVALSVAWRFLRGRRSRLLDGTARSALAATLIGVTAMVIAMALMSGYRHDLRQKLVGGNAAILVFPLAGDELASTPALRERLESVPGVVELRRVAYGQGSLTSRRLPGGEDVALRGVEPDRGVTNLGAIELLGGEDLAAAMAPPDGVPGVVVGAELAASLAPETGEALRLMVLGLAEGRPRFRYRSVRVVGTFESGFSEFDRRFVVIDRRLLQQLAGDQAEGGVWEVATDDGRPTAAVALDIEELLGANYVVRDWQEINAELFAALALQQLALFFVLGLIVLVSTFNVASSLVVLVRERMRDVGVLAALGLRPAELRAIFLAFGGFISLAGTLGGIGIGTLVAWVATRFELIRFDPEVAAVYFLSAVSFRIRWLDLAAVAAFTLGVTALACWLPARRAAKVRPSAALRYE